MSTAMLIIIGLAALAFVVVCVYRTFKEKQRIDFVIDQVERREAYVKVTGPVRPPSYEEPVTRDDMARIKIAAEAALRSHKRGAPASRNPYRLGTRRHVVWECYYLEATLTAEWWSQLAFSHGNR